MSLRSELDDFLLLDLSLLTASDTRSLVPLQGITLDSLSWLDAEIDVFGSL